MHTLGLQNVSFIDFPGQISAVLFFPGCNLRCPYCHNPELVIPPFGDDFVTLDEAFEYLNKRKKVLGGVVLSGGEPLLHTEIPEIIGRIRSLGLAVKLDTNGTFPDRLISLSPDFIAIDIKTSLHKYGLLGGDPDGDLRSRIEASIDWVLRSGIPHEIRTTVVPGIVEAEDVDNICSIIKGCSKYVFAQFRPGKTLDPAYSDIRPYPAETLEAMKVSAVKAGIPCSIRGIG